MRILGTLTGCCQIHQAHGQGIQAFLLTCRRLRIFNTHRKRIRSASLTTAQHQLLLTTAIRNHASHHVLAQGVVTIDLFNHLQQRVIIPHLNGETLQTVLQRLLFFGQSVIGLRLQSQCRL